MTEQRMSEDAGRSLSEQEPDEVEVEADVTDADLEEATASPPTAPREAVTADLSEEELAEADAEADLIDADIEDA